MRTSTADAHPVASLPKKFDLFIGIDSDDCAFDSLKIVAEFEALLPSIPPWKR